MSKLDLTAVVPGDQIDDEPFVLARKVQGTTTDGRPYFSITLRNGTGSISGRIWQERLSLLDGVGEGDPVSISGRIKPGFKSGPPEIDIYTVKKLDRSHPIMQCLNPVCPVPLETLQDHYDALVSTLSAPWRAFLDAFFTVGCPWEDYISAPAAVTNHHAYIHGLFEHHIEVAETALQIGETYASQARIDRDLVIVGALIHDSGKTVEYEWKGCPIRMSEFGLMGNHMVFGPQQVERTWVLEQERLREAGLSRKDLHLIEHIQMSHHGKPEWGAVCTPRFLEAQIVHHADLISAEMRMMLDAIQNGTPSRDGWVNGGVHFRDLYVGPSALSLAPVPATT